MDAKLAIKTIEALEPYARRLVEQAERKGPAYEKKWFLALQQARLVLKAFDSLPPVPHGGGGEPARRSHVEADQLELL